MLRKPAENADAEVLHSILFVCLLTKYMLTNINEKKGTTARITNNKSLINLTLMMFLAHLLILEE